MAKGKFVKKLLDMSHSARMGQAKSQGFNVDETFYHASDEDIDIFDPKRLGLNTLGNASDPAYGATSLLGHFSNTKDITSHGFPAKAVYPLHVRGELADIDSLDELASMIRGKADEMGIDIDNLDDLYHDIKPVTDEIVEEFKEKGYTGLRFPDEEFGGESIAIFDPENIRSVNAAFDPAKKESSSLLASAIPAALGIGALTQTDLSRADKLEELADLAAQEGDEESEIIALEEMKKLLSKLPHSMAQSFIKYGTGEVGSIQAPRSEFLGKVSDLAQKYNTFRRQKLVPVADMLLPVGELPEDALRKMSHGDKLTYLDAVKVALGLL